MVLVVYTPGQDMSTLKGPRVTVQPPHIISGQAIQRFTRTRCLHFRKELTTSAHARANGTVRMAVERIFMTNHNESDLLRPGIVPGTFDSQSNALSTELTFAPFQMLSTGVQSRRILHLGVVTFSGPSE